MNQESKLPEPSLQNNPAEGCHATREGLLDPTRPSRLYEDSWCPLCLRRNVHCEVANHPPSQPPPRKH